MAFMTGHTSTENNTLYYHIIHSNRESRFRQPFVPRLVSYYVPPTKEIASGPKLDFFICQKIKTRFQIVWMGFFRCIWSFWSEDAGLFFGKSYSFYVKIIGTNLRWMCEMVLLYRCLLWFWELVLLWGYVA